MKQILQRHGQVSVEEVPTPAVPSGFVLVRTIASLVSAGTERAAAEAGQKSLLTKAIERPTLVGQFVERVAAEGLSTTLETVRSRINEPVQLGYSAAGTVIRAGANASIFKPGDLVACAGAGYANHAEVLCVPRNLCVPVPTGIPAEDAAFATTGAIALHGVRLANVNVGSVIAVIGLGLMGQLASQIAGASGCRVLAIDLQPDRVDLARRLGADCATSAANAVEMAASLTGGAGVDAVLICADTVGDDPIELAGMLARDRAVVVVVGSVGMNVPRSTYYAKELTLRVSRSYGPGRYDAEYEVEGRDYPIGFVRWTENRNLSAFLDLIARERVRVAPLITHRLPIDSAVEAYEIINGRQGVPFLGVLLTYPGSADLRQSIDRMPSPDRSRPTDDHPKIGVLGAGSFAKAVLLPALKAAGVRMGGIVGRQGVNAKVCADRFGFEYFGTDESRLYSDPSIDVVVIATRHDRHARQALAAAAAGKNVFVEKPLCLAMVDLEHLQRAFSAPDSPRLMVGFNRRFAPLAVRLMEFFRGDGRPPLMINYRVNAGVVPRDHWVHDPNVGGGRIIGEACHFVDFAGWLADAAPLTVTARSLGSDASDDNIVMIITYANGSVATISYVSTGDPTQGKERIEVHGGGRSAVLDDFRRLDLCRSARCETVRQRFAQDKGHRDECAAFVRAIARGEPSPIPLHQLIATTRITFLALESARTGATMPVAE